jgi:fatty acid amide hydrolase 2
MDGDMKAPKERDLLRCSASELADKIRSGKLTSRACVDAHISYVQTVNPGLNAVVQPRFEEARREADEADRRLREEGVDGLPPFHGVPCTIKECFALSGMPHSSGLVSRADVIAKEDATAVARLRAAGAIPLGVTNVSELCMWMESHNQVYGRTNNPYDATRIVGGSSGGEGAIVGSGASPFGLGSDIGGSIRMPAFFNGIFGHKCTGGMVPGTGQYPMAENEARRYLTTGPMCRRAEDLMPLLRVLSGPDGVDDIDEFELGDPAEVEFDKLRVLVVDGNGVRRVSKPLLRAQDRAAQVLADRGAKVERVRFKGLKYSLDIWAHHLNAASETPYRAILGNGVDIDLRQELLRWVVRRSVHTLPSIALAAIEEVPFFQPKDITKSRRRATALRQEIMDRLGSQGVMLYPPYTRVAPRHGFPLATPLDWIYTSIFNTLQFPVTQVPMGLDSQGLPLGVQVVGRYGQDHVTISVAMELERAIGGWVPPWQTS